MRLLRISTTMLGIGLLAGGGLAAQDTAAAVDPAEERIYLQEEPEWVKPRWALGIGVGLVELGDNVIEGQTVVADDDVETYLTINLRIPIGDRSAHPSYGSRGGFEAYLEPEIGFYDAEFATDTLLGVNLIGAMPLNAVEFFVGGGLGIHFIDFDTAVPAAGGMIADDSDEALGVNAQFGVDVSLSSRVGLFAAGRFDLVDDSRDEFEGKAYLGLRFRF